MVRKYVDCREALAAAGLREFATTGPGWVCQGNCAPGCTVILATTS